MQLFTIIKHTETPAMQIMANQVLLEIINSKSHTLALENYRP